MTILITIAFFAYTAAASHGVYCDGSRAEPAVCAVIDDLGE